MPTAKAIAVALAFSIISIGIQEARAQEPSDSFNIYGTFFGNGFQTTLPDGWVGRQLDENSVMAIRSESLSTQTAIEITATIGRTSISGWEWIEANAYLPGCTIASASYVEVNQGIGKVLEAECEPSEQWPYTILLIHEFLGSGENEALFFSVVWATTHEVLDQNQSDVQGMIESFIIQDVADIRQKVAELYQLQPQEKTVMLNGIEVIVNIQSASDIEDFSLDAESGIMKFRAGETHPAGQLTILSIGSILDGPYQVTIEGQTVENPTYYTIEDKITGQTFLVIRHDASDEVAIQGSLIAEESSDQTQPTYITGKYTWGDIGMTFPDGWIAVNQNTVLLSVPSKNIEEGQNAQSFLDGAIYVTVILPSLVTADSPTSFLSGMTDTCDAPQISYAMVKGIPAKEIIENCSITINDIDMKAKSYYFGIQSYYVNNGERKSIDQAFVLEYVSTIEDFDSNIADFESLVNSLEFSDRMTDIRDVDYRALGLSSTTEKVTANGNEVEIKIDSNARVSDLKLDDASKSVFFRTEGEDGTRGTTIINIGSVLEGPYSVTIDGQSATDDVILVNDKITGETSIMISYENSVHEIMISGTQVVPEFQLPFLLTAVSITVIVTIGKFRHWKR